MTTATAKTLACVVALLGTFGATRSLHAQLGVGTWVRQDSTSAPRITMDVAPCCNGGYRLTYHFVIQGNPTVMT